MPITTKATLETELGNWLHRTDLTGQYEEWEQMAEELFKAPPRRPTDAEVGGIRLSVTRATGSLTAGQAYLSKPSNFMNAYSFTLTADAVPLKYVAPDNIEFQRRTGTGRPRFWTVADVIQFDVAPDSAYAYQLAYYPAVTTIVGASSSATNTVIDTAPLCYLAACLHFAFDYIGDDENAGKWLGRYRLYADNANGNFRGQQFASGAIAAVTDYSTP